MKQACGVDHLTHKCYLPLLLLYLKKNHIKIRAELSGKPLTYSQLLFYLCMILQRCCQKRRLSQANCYHGRVILISLFLRYPILHAPKFCYLPQGFQNCFCFCSTTFPFRVGTFYGFNGNFNGKMTKINKMAKNHFSGVQINSQSVKMGVLGGVFVFKSGLRILIWAPKVPFSVPPK